MVKYLEYRFFKRDESYFYTQVTFFRKNEVYFRVLIFGVESEVLSGSFTQAFISLEVCLRGLLITAEVSRLSLCERPQHQNHKFDRDPQRTWNGSPHPKSQIRSTP